MLYENAAMSFEMHWRETAEIIYTNCCVLLLQ